MSLLRSAAIAVLALAVGAALGETGELRKGESAHHDFEVGADETRVQVVLEWKDRATEWDLVLRSANGVQVTGSTAGLSIEKGPFSYRIKLDRAAAPSLGWEGTWTVRLRLLDTHRKRPVVAYGFTLGNARAGARVKMELEGLDGVHRAGDRVTLAVKVRPAGEETAVGSVSASVVPMGDGEAFDVALRDDGSAPDETAGDGVWTGSLVWQQAGKFNVVATATAVDGEGRSSEHDAGREVRVREARDDIR